MDAIVADDGDGEVGPGERVRYTGTLSNPGDATTTGVVFEFLLDPNLTLDGSTVRFAPVAVPDDYSTDVDTPLAIGQANGVRNNDFDLENPLPIKPVTKVTGQATSQGGTVNIGIRGQFTYTPPSGFSGTDTFTYILTDRDGASVTGTVSVQVGATPPIPGLWFVDDDAGPGGNGSMSAPFQDHSQLNGAGGTGDLDEAGHTIFFYEGTYDIDDSFHIEPGQKIVGQGVDLVFDGSTLVTGSPSQRPALTHDTDHMILLADNVELAGFDVGTPTTPVGGIGLNGSAGGLTSLTIDEMTIHTDGGPAMHLVDGVLDIDLLDVTASHASGAALIIGGSATGTTTVAGTATLSGSTFGAQFSGSHTVNLATVDIDAAAGTGIAASGGVAVTIGSPTPLTKGALTNGSVDAIGGPALDFSGAATLTGTLTSLSSTNSTGKGLCFNTGTHDVTVTGTTAISNATGIGLHISAAMSSVFTFGPTTVNGAAEGILLNSNPTSAFDFGDTDVSNVAQDGIEIANSTGTHTFATGSSITSTSTGYGLRVDNGSPTVGYDGSITNTAGRSVSVTGLTGGSVTVGGTIDDDGQGIVSSSNAGATINLDGNLDLDTTIGVGLTATNGGTVNVNGASNAITTTTASAISCASTTLAGTFHDVDVSAGASTGVFLSSCAGTKTFVDVDVTTTGAHGFHASNAGTIQVTGISGAQALSTANTTNARAVNIEASTQIGAAGVMFGSVTSSGGDHGIRLHTVGGTGAFHVTGTGPSDPTISVGTRGREGTSNGTGGTLTGSTNDHVSLTSVSNVVLRHMVMTAPGVSGDDGVHASGVNGLVIDNTRIENTGTHGVRGVNLSNLTVLNSEIFNPGDADEEDGFNLLELRGTSSITNTIIDDLHTHGIEVFNDGRTSPATPDRLMVQNTEVTDSHPTDGEIGIKFETSAGFSTNSNFSLEVSDSFISRVEGNAIQASSAGTNSGDRSRVHLSVLRTTVVGSGAAPDLQVPTAVAVTLANQAEATFVIDDNNAANGAGFSDIPTSGILIQNNSNGTAQGTISDTDVSAGGSGINVTAEGIGATGTTTVDIRGNTATSTNAQGVKVFARDGTNVTVNATIEGNTISNSFDFDFALWLRVDDAADGCYDVGGTPASEKNTLSATGSFSRALFLDVTGGNSVARLEGYGGAANDITAINAFLTGNNTILTGTVLADTDDPGDTIQGTGSCPTPVTPLLLASDLPEIATTSPEAIELAQREPAPMPEPLARERRTSPEAAPRATQYVIGQGASVGTAASGPVASGPSAEEPVQPSVEVAEVASGANMATLFTLTLHDFPAGMSSSFAFEATTGQNIKTDELSTTVTLSASNATSVDQTATTDALPSRQIPAASGAGWRTLGVPVDGTTVDDLAQQNLVQCILGYYETQGRCTNPQAIAVNLFTGYNGTNLIAATGPGEVIQRGRGIYWYMFNATFDPNAPNPGPSPSQSYALPVTLSQAGPVPAGDVTVPLHADGDRWNMLANPFPMDLDISGIGGWTTDGTLTTPIGQVWNPNKKTFILTSQKDNRVAAWQGVFIRNQDAVSLTFMESAVVGDAQFVGKAPVAAAPTRGLAFELVGATASGQPTADEAIVVEFLDGAHPGADAADVDKLAPPMAAYSVAAVEGDDGTLLAQRSLPRDLDRAIEIPLHVVAVGTAGAQTLTWPRMDDIPTDWTLRLVDQATGTEVYLRDADAYAFTPDASGASTASGKRRATSRGDMPDASLSLALPTQADALTGTGSAARFLLVIGPGEPEPADAATPEATTLDGAFPNPFGQSTAIRYTVPAATHVRLIAFDVLGREVAVLADAPVGAGTHTATWTPGPLASGTYVVRLRSQTESGATTERSLRVTHNR